MGILSAIFGGSSSTDEYSRGYNAAGEFLDLTSDRILTDEECNAQWNVIEATHSSEYVDGYGQRFSDEAERPWWKIW